MFRIITDENGDRWHCEAVSRQAALNEITMARATGSIGGSSYSSSWPNPVEKLISRVHRINSDYSFQKPYTKVY